MVHRSVETVSEAIEDFRRVMRGRYAKNTWDGVDRMLTRFEDFIAREAHDQFYLTDVDDRHLVRFFDRMRPPKYEPSTFNNYRQYMTLFFTYCREEGWIHSNPMRHVKPMRINKRVRLQLSKEELLLMLEQAEIPRDRAALAVGMNTALRAGDAAALTVGSLDFYSDRVTAWIEKTDKEILLPMTSDLRSEMLRWLTHYAEHHGLELKDLPNDWTLLPPCRGHAKVVGDPSQGYNLHYKVHDRFRHPEVIVKRALEKMGYPTEREGFHTLRRSALRALYDDGIAEGDPDPIRLAQALADHASRATTEIYLGVTHEKRLLDEKLRGKGFLSRTAGGNTATDSEAIPIKRGVISA